jgi:hypothetical protein
MYRSEVIDALQKLHEKTLWMRTDIEAPIHAVTNEDRKELCDLCLSMFKVFCVGTDYFLNKKLIDKELEDVTVNKLRRN